MKTEIKVHKFWETITAIIATAYFLWQPLRPFPQVEGDHVGFVFQCLTCIIWGIILCLVWRFLYCTRFFLDDYGYECIRIDGFFGIEIKYVSWEELTQTDVVAVKNFWSGSYYRVMTRMESKKSIWKDEQMLLLFPSSKIIKNRDEVATFFEKHPGNKLKELFDR